MDVSFTVGKGCDDLREMRETRLEQGGPFDFGP